MLFNFISLRFNRLRRKPATFASITTVGLFGTSLVIRLASSLLLSRLVLPDVFGLMALAMIAIMGLVLLSDVGLTPAVIHHSDGDEPDFLNTAWTIQVFRGIAIWLASWIAAPAMAWFYAEPILTFLIPVIAIMVVIEGFCSTGVMTAQRQLTPSAMIGYNVLSQFFGTLVTLGIACFYPNVWSLVAGTLAGSLCRLVTSFCLPSLVKHRLLWHHKYAWELFHFGKWIFLSTAATFFALQIDRIVLGKLGSLETLGLYSMGATIAAIPVLLITHIGDYVMFPLLAKAAREDPAGLREKTKPVRGRILGLSLIMNVGVFATAPLLFNNLYGSEYRDAGRLCQWLVVSSWLTVIVELAVQTLKAVGNVQSMAGGKVVRLLVTIPLTVWGFDQYGIEGFIVGFTIGILPEHLVMLWRLYRLGLWLPLQEIGYTSAFLLAIVSMYWSASSIATTLGLGAVVGALTLWGLYLSVAKELAATQVNEPIAAIPNRSTVLVGATSIRGEGSDEHAANRMP
ncbi:Teichuronic acid biosynthesis protein TuaB [Novipirellula galeiformis]|uniref:Teichuronic acid biosynthesis protein TuaB n=1 Tax=Novipirellula galeiformis TaxID=2528004 RepID=A0A5C6CIM2_9BACT|nr:oligosaccharide flippase family protein [Novipirellula galeiformis]TWU23955.1 Teichuronic acid biosynthesis protein TuaB [Novipirellula galeiformis]